MIDPVLVRHAEEMIQGILVGFSFIGQEDCVDSLSNVVTYGADVF